MPNNRAGGSHKTVSTQKITERIAVNAVRDFFERHSQVYLEVDQSRDYGKDAYVDLVEKGELTGLVISIQVKGGQSYRRGSGYCIPYSPADRNLWVDSSVPVFGIVHDDERSRLHWVNLTSELLDRPSGRRGTVDAERLLDDSTWSDFYQHAVRSAKLGGRSILGLHSENPDQQHAAISDCFAIGRFDSRALIMLKRSLQYLSPESVEHAIYALATCMPHHPDRFWTRDNTVSGRAQSEFLRALKWTPYDAAHLLKHVDNENMFRRGSIGQDIYLLLSRGWGPDVYRLFEETLKLAMGTGDMDVAFKSLAIIQYQSGEDAPEVLFEIVKRYPALFRDGHTRELLISVQREGWLDIE